jgi:hypothetical protein
MTHRIGEIDARCPECKGDNLSPSTFPGCARCGSCGKVFPAPKARERAEAEQAEWEADTGREPKLIVPDQVAVEYGWRAWGIRKAESEAGMPLLQSINGGHTAQAKVEKPFWQPRVPMEAICVRHDHEVPDERCECGLYSAKTLDHLMTMRHYYRYDPAKMFKVIGKVALWGKVIEGTQGWKATYGYPSELYLPFEAWHLHNDLHDAYGCPIYLKNFLRERND